jgi:hypothetical protein
VGSFPLPDWLQSGVAEPPPETGEVRYIGKSTDPKRRLANHLCETSACHRTHWLRSLAARGLKPVLVTLEVVEGRWPWQEAERWWIARGRALGWRLTNSTSGGDGVPNLSKEARERIATGWRGRNHTSEARQRVADARAALTTAQAEAIRQRLAAGERATDIAAELGLCKASITRIKQGRYRGRRERA